MRRGRKENVVRLTSPIVIFFLADMPPHLPFDFMMDDALHAHWLVSFEYVAELSMQRHCSPNYDGLFALLGHGAHVPFAITTSSIVGHTQSPSVKSNL